MRRAALLAALAAVVGSSATATAKPNLILMIVDGALAWLPFFELLEKLVPRAAAPRSVFVGGVHDQGPRVDRLDKLAEPRGRASGPW